MTAKEKRKGFVLLTVVALISLIGIEISILSQGSSLILEQTKNINLDAINYNLTASGIAWVQKNISSGNIKGLEKTVELNVEDSSTQKTDLTIKIKKVQPQTAEVEIITSCNFNHRIFKRTRNYLVPLK